MSVKIKPLSLRMIDALMIIHGAMELGIYDASLTACAQVGQISQLLTKEIELIIKERHAAEIRAIRALMPRKD